MSDIKLVIFDCDGVLIDSECLSMQTWQSLLNDYGITITDTYFVSRFLGKSMQHVESQVKQDFNFELTEQVVNQFQQQLQARFESHLHASPGVLSVLDNLNVPYCLATSSSQSRTQHSLACSGLTPYFENKQFTRSMVANGKPAPDLFLLAADSMGVKPEDCLVIEDSLAGIQAARAANMHVLHYIGGSHLTAPACNDVDILDSWGVFFSQYANLRHNEMNK